MAGGLDFNGGDGSAPRPRYDLDKLADALAASADRWVPVVYPRGRISDDKTELRLANIKGAPPRNTGSCVVALKGEKAGSWFDYDGGDNGGPLSTLKHATGLSGRALFDYAAQLSNYAPDVSSPRWSRPAAKPVDHTAEISHILARAIPAAGSLVETYLRSRKLIAPDSPDLLFCNNVSDFKAGVGRPAMIAVVRGADGKPTGGIHRTFLAYDGQGKAAVDKPKRMLGAIQHGAVRLFPVTDGVLGVAEGIETAIAANIVSQGVPVWATLAAGNMGGYDKEGGWTGFELPADVPVRHLIIFADRGAAGERAAALLRDRVAASGIPVDIEYPASGDDFNGDLMGEKAAVPAMTETVASRPEPAAIHRNESENVSRETLVPELFAPSSDAEALTVAVGALTKDTPHDQITAVLRMIVEQRPNPIATRQILNSIRERTKIPAKALEAVLMQLRKEFAPVTVGADRSGGTDTSWMRDIILTEAGEPKALLENAATALERAPEWKGVIWLDQFSERIMLRMPPPWHDKEALFEERPWTDNDDFMATRWLQRTGIHVATPITHEAVLSAGFKNPYHPVREYLGGLKWDGQPRLDHWVCDHLGVEDSDYARAVGARWMISAVARIMRPGIKVDHMLILEGPQERGKSTALRALFDPWFADGMSELGSKDAAIELAGVWLIEFAELDAMRRVERNRLKAFITRASDRYRPPWGRHAIDHPRQMVFAGSVNDEAYLDDPTGGRRFWPVKIGTISIDTLWTARDQLWAEAAHRYAKGELFYLHEADLRKEANEEQSLRQLEDAWHTKIARFLSGALTNEFAKNDASIDEVLAGIGVPIAQWDRVAQNRVAAYFTIHKWDRLKGDHGEFYYRRPIQND